MKSSKATSSKYLLSALMASLCFSGLSLMAAEPFAVKSDGRNAGVVELRHLDQLKDAFQRDVGKTRLIALLSPT